MSGAAMAVAAMILAGCGGPPGSEIADDAAPPPASTSATSGPSSATPAATTGPAPINGAFEFVQKVTKSNSPSYQVGKETTYEATFTSTCAEGCTALTAVINGVTLEFQPKGDHWLRATAGKTECYDGKGKKLKATGKWATEVTYRLDPSQGSGPMTVSGTVTQRETKSCVDGGDKSHVVSEATGTEKTG